ncbi:hypothetical protein HN748_04725 [Candidatus Peregrinibacteria bacterium]|jgi:hypothetical protein|nr:hypothetical protein [Candidatus Peregrinibacteria bacterium]MBT7484077.1 hypothetical protein [Candidatus Peregrinibacteria bacterium]MBT7703514.1 hypothetical protein [Candidatus Peregrinibacteria bacterium]
MAKSSKSSKEVLPERWSSESGKLEEGDRWDKRWEDFDDMFDEFDPSPDEMEGIWQESDLRQQKLEKIRKLLEGKSKKSPFGRDDEEFMEGLKSTLGYFSFVQLEELQRLVSNLDEGLATQEHQERFEKNSKTEERD